MNLDELGSLLQFASGAIDEVLRTLADAIEDDPEAVVEILRSDEPVGDRLERIKELVDE